MKIFKELFSNGKVDNSLTKQNTGISQSLWFSSSDPDEVFSLIGDAVDMDTSQFMAELKTFAMIGVEYLVTTTPDYDVSNVNPSGTPIRIFFNATKSNENHPIFHKPEVLYALADKLSRSLTYSVDRFYFLDEHSFALLKAELEELQPHKNISVQNTDRDSGIYDAVREVLSRAALIKASDVHLVFDSNKGRCDLFFRKDKRLQRMLYIPIAEAEAWIRFLHKKGTGVSENELKMDAPNDWRNEIPSKFDDGTTITLRYNQLPGAEGLLSSVMRINTKRKTKEREILTLKQLGFLDCQAGPIMQRMMVANGLVILVGTTNSGKTTTAEQLLNEKEKRVGGTPKFVTLEDPVELNNENFVRVDLNSIRTDAGDGPTKSILRQDADEVYLGEVRDQTGGQLAFDIYNSGNHCMTTMHCADSLSAISKIQETGGWSQQDALNPDAILAIIFQRLDVKLCQHCALSWDDYLALDEDGKTLREHEPLNKTFVKQYPQYRQFLRFRNPDGCEHCRKRISKVELFGRTVEVGRKGEAGISVSAEVLISSAKLFSKILSDGMLETKKYYQTLYRLEENGAYAGFSAKEHAAHKMLNGLMCPFDFNLKINQVDVFFELCRANEMEINKELLKRRFPINDGKLFDFMGYLKDVDIVEKWQQEYRGFEEAELRALAEQIAVKSEEKVDA